MMAATAKTKATAKGELLSISKIAMRCNLDRATCRKRLDLNGYTPESEKNKEKLYRFDKEMEATLTESQDKLTDIRIRKETADAQLKELKVREANGELAPVAEFVDAVQKIFSALYQDIAVRQPSKIASKLHRAKSQAEIAGILKAENTRAFTAIRRDFGKYLGEGKTK